MVKDFVSREDLSLFTSGSRFSLASVFLREGLEDTIATFDLLVRELPATRNYFVFAGLEHVAEYLLNLHLAKEHVEWLSQSFSMLKNVREYFERFRFTGDMYAMPEGTIFFPNEPVIRITAPIIEAQIIEMFLINTVYVQTSLASKIARFVHAANGKGVGIGFNRSYGTDAAMKSARINEILGVSHSLALYHFKHGSSPFSTGTFHYLIMAFKNELDAFRAYLKHMGGKGYVLIDTYDSIRGIRHFIRAAQELERTGVRATGIQLDSGDLYSLSVKARKMLDATGLSRVKIFAMSNLDEWKVATLEKRKAPIDVYAGVTELLTPSDAPTLELVYKLSELRSGEVVSPKMKTSKKKTSLPGRKQVFRIRKGSSYTHDIVGLEGESVAGGRKLLLPVIREGKLVASLPSLERIRKYYNAEHAMFSPKLHSLGHVPYPVRISPKLKALARRTARSIREIHHDTDIS